MYNSSSGPQLGGQGSVPVDMHWDGDPTPEQKIRKWALELAVEWLKDAGTSHTYTLDVAEEFELFIASAERSKDS